VSRLFGAALLLILAVGIITIGFAAGMEMRALLRPRSAVVLDRDILSLREPRLPLVVTATAYSLTADQTDATPFISRCGRIDPRGVPAGGGRFLPAVAVSQDLLAIADCGAIVRVDGREKVVWDTMHPRWRMRVDRLLPSRAEALAHGVRPALLEVIRP
jgi:3D (Asp-Asp-Asp) domain-containing protein